MIITKTITVSICAQEQSLAVALHQIPVSMASQSLSCTPPQLSPAVGPQRLNWLNCLHIPTMIALTSNSHGSNKGVHRHDTQRALGFRVPAICWAQHGPDLVFPPPCRHCCELFPLCTRECLPAARLLAFWQLPTLRGCDDKVDNACVRGTHCI